MSTLLIINGTVLNRGQEQRADVLLRDGKVQRIGTNLGQADETIDAAGCYVCPGLLDIHVHFREPGDEEEETIESGAAAAVMGGFTTVCCMPNTSPPMDNEAAIEFVLRESQRVGLANVLPVGCMTKGRAGKELAEMGSMHARGAAAFSDDGSGVSDPAVMRKALQYAKMFDGLIMQHAEDPHLSGAANGRPNPMHAGKVSVELGLSGQPTEAETLMISRDLLLNQSIKARYHVQHVSTGAGVELIRRAKRDGIPVTAEASPHHLLLTDENCRGYDPMYKMNPPLRTAADVAALIEGVVDGTIDILATDHAPHRSEEKHCEFDRAAFGIIGLECALPLYAKALIEPGHLTWPQMIERMTTKPAEIIRSDRGVLEEGRVADVTIIDPKKTWTIDAGKFASRSRNCPFDGWDVTGGVTYTIVDGRVVYKGH